MGKKEKTEARAARRKAKLIKKIIIWVIILAGLGAGMFYLAGSADDSSDGGAAGEIPPVTLGDWVKWSADSSVQLVEYSDFQCPACKVYSPLIKAVGEEYRDRVVFVYRHYPIAQSHLNANAAARAAEAAGNQGKFWEMHDMLFETQELWASMGASEAAAVFAGYARGFDGVNIDQYLADFDSEETQAKVTEDFAAAVGAGVNSTPTFFLNGEKIKNPADIDGFRALLDKALADAETGVE